MKFENGWNTLDRADRKVIHHNFSVDLNDIEYACSLTTVSVCSDIGLKHAVRYTGFEIFVFLVKDAILISTQSDGWDNANNPSKYVVYFNFKISFAYFVCQ